MENLVRELIEALRDFFEYHDSAYDPCRDCKSEDLTHAERVEEIIEQLDLMLQ